MLEELFCPQCGSKNIEPKHEEIWRFSKRIGSGHQINAVTKGFMPRGSSDYYNFYTDFEPKQEF